MTNQEHKKERNSENSTIKKIIEQRQKNPVNSKKEKEVKKDVKEIEYLTKEIESLKKSLAYSLAEKENIKKTAQKELENTKSFCLSDFAKEILCSIENMEKAISYVDRKKMEDDKGFKAFFDGVNLTLKEILATLQRRGVEKVDAIGKKFDHNLHQAIKTIEKEGAKSGEVLEVLQDGYIIKERLLRPAIVVVAS